MTASSGPQTWASQQHVQHATNSSSTDTPPLCIARVTENVCPCLSSWQKKEKKKKKSSSFMNYTDAKHTRVAKMVFSLHNSGLLSFSFFFFLCLFCVFLNLWDVKLRQTFHFLTHADSAESGVKPHNRLPPSFESVISSIVNWRNYILIAHDLARLSERQNFPANHFNSGREYFTQS